MFGLIKELFIGLLTSIVRASNYTKRVSLSNQKSIAQPTFINSHPKAYSQELRYYLFAVNLDRCAGSYNSLDDMSSSVWISSETEN